MFGSISLRRVPGRAKGSHAERMHKNQLAAGVAGVRCDDYEGWRLECSRGAAGGGAVQLGCLAESGQLSKGGKLGWAKSPGALEKGG